MAGGEACGEFEIKYKKGKLTEEHIQHELRFHRSETITSASQHPWIQARRLSGAARTCGGAKHTCINADLYGAADATGRNNCNPLQPKPFPPPLALVVYPAHKKNNLSAPAATALSLGRVTLVLLALAFAFPLLPGPNFVQHSDGIHQGERRDTIGGCLMLLLLLLHIIGG